MSKIPVFVGLDYHREAVQVCVLDGAGRVLVNRSCANDAATRTSPSGADGGATAGDSG